MSIILMKTFRSKVQVLYARTIHFKLQYNLLRAATIMSSQHPMGGRLAIPRNGISYTNEPPMSSNLP